MPKLPTVTGSEALAAFARLGFAVVRVSGSHHNMKKDGHRYVLTVPVHGNKTLAPGTLRALIRAAGVTIEEFTSLI